MAFGISVPWPGIKPELQQWKPEILTTGPQGNSQYFVRFYDWVIFCCVVNISYFVYPFISQGTFVSHFSGGNMNNAAAAAKSLQLCLTLWDPIDSSPPGSPIPGILQARTLEWVAISFSNAWKWKVKVKSLSHVWPLATPWTTAHQAMDNYMQAFVWKYVFIYLGYIPQSLFARSWWQLTPVFLLENHMDWGAWRAIVHGAAQSQRQLSTRAPESPCSDLLMDCQMLSERLHYFTFPPAVYECQFVCPYQTSSCLSFWGWPS